MAGPSVEDSGLALLAEAQGSVERLRLSHAKRTIHDFAHLVAPYRPDGKGMEEMRGQVKKAMRRAVLEKDTPDRCIINFAELIVLCGFAGTMEECEQLVEPLNAIEFAEKYHKRCAAWNHAINNGTMNSERIRISKELYSVERAILDLFANLRTLFQKVIAGRDDPQLRAQIDDLEKKGVNVECLRDVDKLHAWRREKLRELKRQDAFEAAYTAFKDKTEKALEERRSDDGRGSGGGVSMETMMQFMAAMSGGFGGGGRQQILSDQPAAPGAEGPKKPKRKLRTREFTVQDKERLIQLIYGCEANGVKFEKDYETLEAMVYRKPHQVVMMLADQVDDAVLYD